jgi:retron-type reverse transcriptase
MKRVNCLFEQIGDYQNIRLAFLKTIRGKRKSPETVRFCRDIDGNLEKIKQRLSSPDIQWGTYYRFVITDPKQRTISAAPLEDRIIHHAVMNILEPLFERRMIFHSYACRKGKGMHAAVKYAFTKCKSNGWFLKLDIRKYFDSIDHEVLKLQLAGMIKDRAVLKLLDGVIDSYQTLPGKGVPIGNLTSQFFANLYLSSLDHYILEELKSQGFVRYMDDFVLWASVKNDLVIMLEKINAYVENNLRLCLKTPIINKTENGLPFLGFRIKKRGIYLLRKSKKRMIKQVRNIKWELQNQALSEEAAAARIASVHAAVLLARAGCFRVNLWYGSRFGQQPCDTGRQLEQQCLQLRGRQP